MSSREDRLMAGKQIFAKVLQSDVKTVFDQTKAELESRIDADEAIAAELPDGTRIGTVKRSKPRESATVTDSAALLAWVKEHRPDELVQSVNPAYIEALKLQVKSHGHAFDPTTGEVIPGVEMAFGNPSFLPQPDKNMVPMIQAKLAELIAGGLLALPAGEERRAS